MIFPLRSLSALRPHLAPVAIVTGAKALGGISIVILNVWIARQMAPGSYGVFAIAVTGLLLLDGMVGSALDAAVIGSVKAIPGGRVTDEERAGLSLKLAAGGAVTLFIPAAVLLAVSLPAARVALVACLGGLGFLVHRSVLTYFQLRHRFAWYATADLAHTASRCAAVGLVFSAGRISPAVAIGAYAVASWGVALVGCLVILSPRRSREAVEAVAGQAFHTVRRAAGTALATTGVGSLVARLDLLVLGLVATPVEAGLLGAAATIALAPTWLGAYLAPAFTSRILPYSRAGRLWEFFRVVQGGLLALAILGTLLGVVAGPAVVSLLLPPEYAAAGRVVPVLLVAGAAGFFTFPLVLHTLLFLSPRTYLVMDLISLPVLLVLYVVAGRRAGALGVAWVTAVSAVLKAYVAHAAASAAIHREEVRFSGVAAFSGAGALR